MSNDMIKSRGKDVVAYWQGEHRGWDVPRPYEKVALLINTYRACFNTGLSERVRKAEENEEKLILRCAQGSAEDRDAVVVSLPDGGELGHVPQCDAPVLFRLLSAGKTLYATVAATESRGGYPKVKIAVFMQE